MSSALNIGLSTGNVGIGNRSYNDQLIPASNGRINGVNITALNERTRTSRASAEACVSSWVTRASAANNSWNSVTWAPELFLFVAVGESGTGNRVATSPDGITWTTRVSAADNEWRAVIWAPELSLFVAVAASGTGNRVMTSINGITWTTRTSAADNNWISVVWAPELSIFVAVAFTGAGNRVMTSLNGISWTTRASAADNQWISVTWAPELSLFVAVAQSGAANRVMTSPNGITWSSQVPAANNNWRSVTWAPELSIFVAVAISGTGNRVMTSPDGITWTTRASAADISWHFVIWSPELSIFLAVADSGIGNRVSTSPDGISWTTRASAADNGWYSVTWAPELSIFAAVAYSGTGDRVMTSAIGMPNSKSVVKALPSQVTVDANGNVGIGTTVPLANLHVNGDIYSPGLVVQCSTVLYTLQTTYTAPASITPTEISVLNISITPKRANSKIVLQWMINGSINWNSVFLVYRNSTAIGYNTATGNVQWSGVTTPHLDTDDDSSPSCIIVTWIDFPNTTSTVVYSVRVRASTTIAANLLYLGRTENNAGAQFHENGCSTGTAFEIAV